MDQAVRSLLRETVEALRPVLEAAVRQALEGGYGVRGDGSVEPEERLGALDEQGLAARRELVAYLRHLQATFHGGGAIGRAAVDQLVREVAFTHLNRLVALKMAEHPSRRLIREAVGRGTQSSGFKFFRADHPEVEALWEAGQQEAAYHRFLLAQGRVLAVQVGDLFAPESPADRLVPPQRVLEEVLARLNAAELAPAWAEEETAGWVYQYFTPKKQREEARKASPAPRNGHELAFRNQFYTPRYVVEFLTDNCLGLLWCRMRAGRSVLRKQCRYHLWPAEGSGRAAPAALPAKDPRDIKVCDPACGSGHFLLYAFEVLEAIYQEAWQDPEAPRWTENGHTLRDDYPDRETFARAVPGLILKHNLFGVDIDPRAAQIAGLALWLRAERVLEERGVPRGQRPELPRARVVCAEPMPGDPGLLEEFLRECVEPALAPAVRQLVHRLRLAGEIGSLLKAEVEIVRAIEAARRESFHDLPLARQGTEAFWAAAEPRVLEALGRYEERAGNGGMYARRLFARDARQGLALLDALRAHSFDVVLMNPPFGDATPASRAYLDEHYPLSRHDLAAAFVERGLELLRPGGMLGAITTRTPLFLSSSTRWREEVVLGRGRLAALADLGHGVLESAMVETAAYCLEPVA